MVARSPDASRGGQIVHTLHAAFIRSNGEAARKGPRRKDAKIAHIKRRVPLGEKTTHIDKAQMQT